MSVVSTLNKLITERISPAQESETSLVNGILSLIGLSHHLCILSSQQPTRLDRAGTSTKCLRSNDAERTNDWLKVSQL